MKLGTEVGLVPGHIVLDGDPAHPAQKGHSSPNLWHMSVKTKWLDGSRCHLACRQPRSRPHCVTWGPSFSQKGHIPQFSANVCCGETAGCVMGTQPPPQGAQQPPLFGPCLLWPNRSMDQDATWCGGRPRPRRHCAQLIPLFFVAILPTFQTLSSKCHFAVLSSPDFHALIVLHRSHALHDFTY